MDKNNKTISNLYHTFNCVVCNREVTLFCVSEPNYDAPCSEKCRQKQNKEKMK